MHASLARLTPSCRHISGLGRGYGYYGGYYGQAAEQPGSAGVGVGSGSGGSETA